MATLREYCVQTGNGSLLREWDAAANGTLTPDDIGSKAKRKVGWKCAKGHTWEAAVFSRVAGYGCPYCSGLKPVVGENDLATTHPEIAVQWHPTENGKWTPRDVSAGSHRKITWVCEKGHVWARSVHHRVYSGSGCPYCSGSLPIPGETDLATRCPEVAAEWDYEKNGDLTPEQVMPRSTGYAWWKCPVGHSYRAAIRSRGGNGSGCPYCSGQAVLSGFNDLATKRPDLAAQWYQPLNGSLTPKDVTLGSNKRAAWCCADGHVWYARIDSRTRPGGHGCPVCRAGKEG